MKFLIICLVLLLSGCYKDYNPDCKFYYGQQVRVIKGFWRTQEGTISNYNERTGNYTVRLQPSVGIRVSEDQLESAETKVENEDNPM